VQNQILFRQTLTSKWPAFAER